MPTTATPTTSYDGYSDDQLRTLHRSAVRLERSARSDADVAAAVSQVRRIEAALLLRAPATIVAAKLDGEGWSDVTAAYPASSIAWDVYEMHYVSGGVVRVCCHWEEGVHVIGLTAANGVSANGTPNWKATLDAATPVAVIVAVIDAAENVVR